MNLHIFPRKYLGSKSSVINISKSDLPKLDDIDYKILAVISSDSRISIVDLAKKLNESAKVTLYHLRKLEKSKIILSYRAKINYSKLNKEYYKVDMNIHDLSKLKSLYHFAFMHPNIIYINQTIGSADFEFDAECDNLHAITSIFNEISSKFPELVCDINYFQIIKVHKISYFPL